MLNRPGRPRTPAARGAVRRGGSADGLATVSRVAPDTGTFWAPRRRRITEPGQRRPSPASHDRSDQALPPAEDMDMFTADWVSLKEKAAPPRGRSPCPPPPDPKRARGELHPPGAPRPAPVAAPRPASRAEGGGGGGRVAPPPTRAPRTGQSPGWAIPEDPPLPSPPSCGKFIPAQRWRRALSTAPAGLQQAAPAGGAVGTDSHYEHCSRKRQRLEREPAPRDGDGFVLSTRSSRPRSRAPSRDRTLQGADGADGPQGPGSALGMERRLTAVPAVPGAEAAAELCAAESGVRGALAAGEDTKWHRRLSKFESNIQRMAAAEEKRERRRRAAEEQARGQPLASPVRSAEPREGSSHRRQCAAPGEPAAGELAASRHEHTMLERQLGEVRAQLAAAKAETAVRAEGEAQRAEEAHRRAALAVQRSNELGTLRRQLHDKLAAAGTEGKARAKAEEEARRSAALAEQRGRELETLRRQAGGQSISINFSQLGLPEHVLAREDVQQMVQYNAVETVHQLMASWQGGPVQQQQAPMLMGWQPAGRGAAQQRPRSADEWEGGGPGAKRPAIGAERAPLSPAEQVPLSADQLAQAKTGTVKSWSNANKYGFIIPDEGGRDVLADVASLSPLFNGELEAGSAVCYTLKMGSTAGKQRAASVQPSDGTERALVRHGGAGRGQPAGPVRNAAHAARQQAAAAAPYGAPVALRNAQQPPPPPPAPQLRTHAAPLHGDSATTSGFGTVKSYNPQKGFGFIQDDATGQDIHVGQDVLAKAGLQGMEKGMRLGFLLVPSRSRASQVWPSD
eukprot:TRINITY_DN2663_c0_g1_i1.p1 TRINITY_DN2663_c0_g1~~TRINITY_DN2663_c0_g1_i1.p1  ORF type:complete len:795 (+),score=216.98 TRINITY_DN2663_c0_g1_i1:137-2521(+)